MQVAKDSAGRDEAERMLRVPLNLRGPPLSGKALTFVWCALAGVLRNTSVHARNVIARLAAVITAVATVGCTVEVGGFDLLGIKIGTSNVLATREGQH